MTHLLRPSASLWKLCQWYRGDPRSIYHQLPPGFSQKLVVGVVDRELHQIFPTEPCNIFGSARSFQLPWCLFWTTFDCHRSPATKQYLSSGQWGHSSQSHPLQITLSLPMWSPLLVHLLVPSTRMLVSLYSCTAIMPKQHWETYSQFDGPGRWLPRSLGRNPTYGGWVGEL